MCILILQICFHKKLPPIDPETFHHAILLSMRIKVCCMLLLMGALLEADTVLVTGFGPFGDVTENISYLAVKDLHGEQAAGRTIHTAEIPVVWDASAELLKEVIRELSPEAVIALGIDEGLATGIVLEQYALNRTSNIPDIEGRYPPDHGKVVAQGPDVLFSPLDVYYLKEELEKQGISVTAGEHPGGYLCGWVYYLLLFELEPLPVLFIHAAPSVSQELLRDTVTILIESLLF